MLTLNGLPIIEMLLVRPVSGLWVASMEVASEEAITGAVTLAQAGTSLSYAAYAVRSGALVGSCRLDIVGGVAAGLRREVEARSYQGANARTIAGELLVDVGESLDVTSTRSVMTTTLPYWTRTSGRASQGLFRLADSVGARWRIQPSGAIWFGTDSWPEQPELEADELDRDARSGTVLLAPDTIELSPGVTYNGDRVARVEYIVSRSESLRATYWVEDT